MPTKGPRVFHERRAALAALGRMRDSTRAMRKDGRPSSGREWWNRNVRDLRELAAADRQSFARVVAAVPSHCEVNPAGLERALDLAADAVKVTSDDFGSSTPSAAQELREAVTPREKVAAVENVVAEMIGDAIRRARKGGGQ